MFILSVTSFILHILVIHKGVSFFRMHEQCRDQDKTIVAALIAASVFFLLAQFLTWGAYARGNYDLRPVDGLWYAFDLFNAIFYLVLVRGYTQHRVCHVH